MYDHAFTLYHILYILYTIPQQLYFKCSQCRQVKLLMFLTKDFDESAKGTVPLKLDDNVSFSKEFSLVATINHSGSLNAGHYWAIIKDNISKSWFKCDDRSILKVKPSTLNNTTSYVLFYVRS